LKALPEIRTNEAWHAHITIGMSAWALPC
jgi:hypothetical protein